MRFGKTLREAIYPPWAEQYIDYAKLKALLRENGPDEDKPWTEAEETRFCEELLNVQLEKIAAFQEKTFKELEQRASKCDDQLRDIAPQDGNPKGELTVARLKELEAELDGILNEFRQLRRYSNINYTGFMKIVKKHDRKRGDRYKIRPMVSVSLAKRPFNTEQGYTHMMHKLSLMFFAVRQQLEGDPNARDVLSTNEEINNAGESYKAYKFWVHPENLLEVKTAIARRLPVLVYSQQASLDTDPSQSDPKITSIYFDNAKFALYNQKANKDREGDASSLRLRWYGQLDSKSDIVLEEKIIHHNGSSEEEKLPIKEKYIQSFINGSYAMEKSIQKMERQGVPQEQITEFRNRVTTIQNFIKAQDLQPVLRANYTRTAFQTPFDDRVRVSIDTELVFIREDVWDSERPCRNPNSWHRLDIDENNLEYPFSTVNKGEISRFPFAVLEIKVKDDATKKGSPQWVQDLMSSHLVYPADGFSKFVHGIASLFEDQVNILPFWLNQLESDIRQDPEQAFKEEEGRKAKQAEEAVMVGSYLGTSKSVANSYKPAVSSPVGKSYIDRARRVGESSDTPSRTSQQDATPVETTEQPEADVQPGRNGYGTFSSIIPSFSRAKYNQARRRNVELPPGVTEPLTWLKNDGDLKVELKVWLANERTFLKWSHICILLGSLSITLYTASGLNTVGEATGIAFLVIALLAGLWGYYMQITRRKMIRERSGRDFDNIVGPLFVSFAMMIALILNFVFKWQEVKHRGDSIGALNMEATATSGMSWKNEKFLWEALGDRLIEKFWF